MPDVPVVLTNKDMNELAVRLGGISIISRTGRVYFLDDFSSGIDRWIKTSNGTGFMVTWSSQWAYMSGFSLRMETQAAVAGSSCRINRADHDSENPLGVEFSWRYSSPSLALNVGQVKMVANDTAVQVGLQVISGLVTLRTRRGFFTLPSQPTISDTDTYFWAKYTWDYEKRVYKSLNINGNNYDSVVNGLPINSYQAVAGSYPYDVINTDITAYGNTVDGAIHLGHIILTEADEGVEQ